jgi:hypothetical protein
MELLCVEVIMKRKELLGIKNEETSSNELTDKSVMKRNYNFKT